MTTLRNKIRAFLQACDPEDVAEWVRLRKADRLAPPCGPLIDLEGRL